VEEIVMPIASGFVEADSADDAPGVVAEFQRLGVEVPGVTGDRVLFLVERARGADLRAAVESFGAMAGVRSVYVAYVSVEEETPP
jgi:hypothetical protein